VPKETAAARKPTTAPKAALPRPSERARIASLPKGRPQTGSRASAVPAPAAPAAPAEPKVGAEPNVSLTAPAGAPHVEILFIQWASDPGQRLVSLRNLAGTLLVLREGDLADPAEGMKVAHIGRKWVDFSWKKNLFRVAMDNF